MIDTFTIKPYIEKETCDFDFNLEESYLNERHKIEKST